MFFVFLAATGIALGCAASVKLVGLGAAALVGLHSALQLWEVWGQWQHPLRRFVKHFMARFALLGALPAVVYVSLFVLHVRLVSRTGPGDGFVSRRFQESIQGNGFAAAAAAGERAETRLFPHATVTVRRMYGDECWLTVVATPSSEQLNGRDGHDRPQRVVRCVGTRADNGGHSAADDSLWWELVPVVTAARATPLTNDADNLQHNAVVLLRHVMSGVFLNTTSANVSSGTPQQPPVDVIVSPLSQLGLSNTSSDLKALLWRIDILGQDSTVLYLSKSLVRFVHVASHGALQCTNAPIAQQRAPKAFPCLVGADIQDTTGGWHFDRARQPRVEQHDPTDGGGKKQGRADAPSATDATMPMTDLEKVVELHSIIFARNNELSGQVRSLLPASCVCVCVCVLNLREAKFLWLSI